MESQVIRIKAFVDDAHYQQLLDLDHGAHGELVHFTRDEGAGKNWQDKTDPDRDELIAVALEDLPLAMPEAWEKSALLSRLDAGYSMVLFKSDPDNSIIRELQRPLIVHIPDEVARIQCAQQFPHWTITEVKKEAEAAVLPTRIWRLAPGSFRVFHFDPSEIVPSPGSGSLCLVTPKNNRELKLWCRKYHDKATTECTNLERRIRQLATEKGIPGNIAANVQRTDQGFSVAAALIIGQEVRRSTMSVASSTGAAELIVSTWQ